MPTYLVHVRVCCSWFLSPPKNTFLGAHRRGGGSGTFHGAGGGAVVLRAHFRAGPGPRPGRARKNGFSGAAARCALKYAMLLFKKQYK